MALNKKYRTHTCGEIRGEHVDQEVVLAGWIHRIRDHGGLVFIDLRDHYGITQCVMENEPREEITPESVVLVRGKVVHRPAETVNKELPTGEVEIQIQTVQVISQAEQLPMQVFGDQDYPEDMLLKYRYLSLRREKLHSNINLRHNLIAFIRASLMEEGFMEFQTPIITAPSPEGARDFIIPSRLHHGKFYSLPQAPQQWKQLCMIAGFDKYFQIAPCFRDEDSRADRSAEFYQVDMEMSFVDRDDILRVTENLFLNIWRKFAPDRKILREGAIPVLTYKEAIEKYGTDKPDLRSDLEICSVTDAFKNCDFKVFANAVDQGKVVLAIAVQKELSRSFFDAMNSWAQSEGAPGMGYAIFENREAKGPVGKFIKEKKELEKHESIKNVMDKNGALFFICDHQEEARQLASKARVQLSERLNMLDKEHYAFCWVVDFPMYEKKGDKLQFSHNPFSKPKGGIEELQQVLDGKKEATQVLGDQYDLVCNGVELGSGSMRSDSREMLQKAFQVAGESTLENFPAFDQAFRYGVPPHGGIAPGLERILMLLTDSQNIREVTAFPTDAQYRSLLMESPLPLSNQDLKEYGIARLATD